MKRYSYICCIFILIGCHTKLEVEPDYIDLFSGDLSQWVVEGDNSTVQLVNGQLNIDTYKGVTIWFHEKLTAPLRIKYEAKLVDAGGANDRVSDLNCFWLALDPNNPDDFFAKSTFRNGIFKYYDTLQLYYVGQGGHDNSRTRFRRYHGTGAKPLLPEHDLTDSTYLLKANTTNHIKIEVAHGISKYFRNDQLIYEFRDSTPYHRGYFGFRTTRNHMIIDNFKVYLESESN
ncbi:DUF6250 domain-containing protein [Portibacter marinus]|uniref:DUF6250 domain-containing protein n=1 Tax=Portibacter marinus TaxID=2898660 RepID=UPI001F38925F|nr:DUF6250 domain-containing protein [Portibacter marinus]